MFDMEKNFLEPVGYFMQTNQIELSVSKHRPAGIIGPLDIYRSSDGESAATNLFENEQIKINMN